MSDRIQRVILRLILAVAGVLGAGPAGGARADEPAPRGGVLSGREALGDWTTDAPGVRRRIALADLPKPYETRSVDNGPKVVRRPEGAWPRAPQGFTVTEF